MFCIKYYIVYIIFLRECMLMYLFQVRYILVFWEVLPKCIYLFSKSMLVVLFFSVLYQYRIITQWIIYPFFTLFHSHRVKYTQRTKEIIWYLKMGRKYSIFEFMSHDFCNINHLLYFVRSNYILRVFQGFYPDNIFERKISHIYRQICIRYV